MDCSLSSTPTFDSCSFKNNSALEGGAISISGKSGPTILNSHFIQNRTKNIRNFVTSKH